MVNIHKCKLCNEDVYYKPVFGSANGFLGNGSGTGYTTSFQKMSMDKTVHNCEAKIYEEKEEAQRWADYEAECENRERCAKEAYENWREFVGIDA